MCELSKAIQFNKEKKKKKRLNNHIRYGTFKRCFSLIYIILAEAISIYKQYI